MAGSGAGSRLPTPVLVLAGLSTLVAVLVSMMSIHLQLRNYRKPALQRMVVRIMVMVPLYAISSLISLFSLEAAFVIDAIRDIYEAFVIYCFFVLLLSYLGGERSLLILLHGRPPKEPPVPINLVKHEIDVSDPYTFLFLKRGILQYVQVKPLLAAATLILKAVGKFNEGDFRANSGYLYISIIYNVSICLSLYCLAMFWICVNDDLKPFRPVPKFLCVKGILFFSFWQSVVISTLVATRVITRLGPYTEPENISVGLNDLFICIEMPFFAFAHMYAFSYKDFIDPTHTFVARMPMYYAFRDAFGSMDVIEDTRTTLRGKGMDYREFEPAEGFMHQGLGRDRRIRAGLRYSKGGKRKYWLPKAAEESRPPGRVERVVNKAIKRVAGDDQAESVHAPLLAHDAEDTLHLAPDLQSPTEDTIWGDTNIEDGFELPFGDVNEADEELFAHSKKYLFGDYNYPVVDCCTESARTFIWDEEERVLRDEQGAWFSPIRGAKGQAALQKRDRPAWEGYGAVSNAPALNGKTQKIHQRYSDSYHPSKSPIAADPKEVTYRWSTTRAHAGSQSSQSSYVKNMNSQPARRTPSSSPGPSSAASDSNPTNPYRSPPSLTHTNTRTARSSGLPSDAVDLVVEDHSATEEQTHERRKGNPTTRASGLRRVYQRGFVDDMPEDGEGDVEEILDVRDDDYTRRVDLGGEIMYSIDDEEHEDELDIFNRLTSERLRETGVLARTGTPPIHAQLPRPGYYDIPDDDNPWVS